MKIHKATLAAFRMKRVVYARLRYTVKCGSRSIVLLDSTCGYNEGTFKSTDMVRFDNGYAGLPKWKSGLEFVVRYARRDREDNNYLCCIVPTAWDGYTRKVVWRKPR